MADYERFERDLEAACERAVAAGLEISDNSGFGLRWTEDDDYARYQARGDCVCPLGALLIDEEVKSDMFECVVAQQYGLTADEVEAFWRVFDAGREYALNRAKEETEWVPEMPSYITGRMGDLAERFRTKYLTNEVAMVGRGILGH